jgi:hypothetical protein
VNTNNTDPCSDGNACTDGDICAGGGCSSGGPLNCDDTNGCTDDSCNPASGCVNTNNTDPCSDGNACTTSDTCGGGNCNGGSLLSCDDTNGCTDDSCDPASGCVNTNNTDPCSDGNACTEGDICAGGSCSSGGPVTCDDGFACSTDVCDEGVGMCVYDAVDCICGDSLPGPAEQCDPPASQGGTPGCTDNCTFVCSTGTIGELICVGGTLGASCAMNADCDDVGEDGVCIAQTCQPSPEICNNRDDDDGDGLVDCLDPDCSEATVPTCSETCEDVNPCKCIDKDPAKIKFKKAPKLDFFKIHARVAIPLADIDPVGTGFGIHLSNTNGIIYEAFIPGSAIVAKTFHRWQYKNRDAKKDLDPANSYKGLFRLGLRYRNIKGVDFLTFRVQAYGDFSIAQDEALSLMTTQVYGFNHVAILTADWNPKGKGSLLNGWSLHPRDIEAGCFLP